ncbi:hypothetical protein REPUB_Repub14bG0007700 [Reevesia pubescens]
MENSMEPGPYATTKVVDFGDQSSGETVVVTSMDISQFTEVLDPWMYENDGFLTYFENKANQRLEHKDVYNIAYFTVDDSKDAWFLDPDLIWRACHHRGDVHPIFCNFDFIYGRSGSYSNWCERML